MTRHSLITAAIITAALLSSPAANAQSGWDRNPFSFAAEHESAEEEGGGFGGGELEMIFISGERKIAVFDGRQFRRGDTIDGYVIQEITLDAVLAKNEGSVKIYRIVKEAGQ